MAFVFKSARDLDKKIERPYKIPTRNRVRKLMKYKSYNSNKLIECLSQKLLSERKQSAFGSNQKRELLFSNKKKGFSPGPGSYEVYDNFIKKSFNKFLTSKDNEEKKDNDNNIDILCQNNLKLFISKEERFKNFNINNDIPGPGEYDLIKLPQLHKLFNKRYHINKSKSFMTKSLKSLNSIPSNGNIYGYKIENNGEQISRESLNKSIENNNNSSIKKSLSPGNYNIIRDKLKKNILDWNKNNDKKKEDTIVNKNNEEFTDNTEIILDENNNIIKPNLLPNLCNNNMSTEPTTSGKINNFSVIISKDSNLVTSSNIQNQRNKINNLKNKNYSMKNINTNNIIEQQKEKREVKKNISYNILRILNDELKHKKILNKYLGNKMPYPGPGEYNLPDEYEKISNTKKCDNFGSSMSRGILFPLKIKNLIGINKEEPNLKICSFHEYDENNTQTNEFDKNNNNTENIIKQNKSEKKDYFSLRLLKKSNNQSIKVDKLDKLDNIDTEIDESQYYNLNNNNSNSNINSNSLESSYKIRNISKSKKYIEHFGSLSKRFNDLCKKEITPGVGTYSLVKTQENKYNKYQSKSPYNIIIQNLNKNKNTFSDNLKNEIQNLNHKSPPVGLYYPELRDCIEYNCKKKCQRNGRNAPFSYNSERFYEINSQKDFSNDIGKYNLIKGEKEMTQQKAPFSFSDERNNVLDLLKYKKGNNNTDNLGAGSYRNGSYFDWIKKSFNKDFN